MQGKMFTVQYSDPFTNEVVLPIGRRWFTTSDLHRAYATNYSVQVYVWYPGQNMGSYVYRADGYGNQVDNTLVYAGE